MTTPMTDPTTNIDTHAPAVELTPAAQEMLDFLSGWMHDCVRRQWEKKAREEEQRRQQEATARPEHETTPGRQIPLLAEDNQTIRAFAIVDADDFDALNQHVWRLHSCGYAVRCDNGTHIFMHRIIMDADPALDVDHRNRDRLDNRRSNLRMASRSQNNANRAHSGKGKSIYQGVAWSKRHSKWIAQIQQNGQRVQVGTFTTEDDAARAYNDAAIARFGEFARLNTVNTKRQPPNPSTDVAVAS